MQNELYKKYAAIEEKFRAIEEERELCRKAIVADLEKAKVENVRTDYGTFTRSVRLTWSYSEKVGQLEEKVKLAKLKEQKQGKATAKETAYLLYKKNNEQ